MIRQVKASDLAPGKEALAGKIFAVRVVSFTPGDQIAFNDPNSKLTIFAAAPTYRRRRGYERVYLFPSGPASSLVIEATEDVEEELDPAAGLTVDVSGATKVVGKAADELTASIVNAASPFDALNNRTFGANEIVTTKFIDAARFRELYLLGVMSLTSISCFLRYSADGVGLFFETGNVAGGANFQQPAFQTNNRIQVATPFIGFRFQAGPVANGVLAIAFRGMY